MTPIICATSVACPTLVRRYDSGRISRLRSSFPTLVDVTTSDVSPDSDRASRLRSMRVPPILPPQLWKTSQGRARWLHHLTTRTVSQNRLGGTHDLISVQNLRSHSFACGSSQAMSRVTKGHLAWHDLRQTWVSRGTQYPRTLEVQSLRMSGQTSLGHGTKNWSHMWKTLDSINWTSFWSELLKALNALWTQHMTPTILSTRLGTTRWKIQTARTGWCLRPICKKTLNVWVQETMYTLSPS
jgi:hypothetical protein